MRQRSSNSSERVLVTGVLGLLALILLLAVVFGEGADPRTDLVSRDSEAGPEKSADDGTGLVDGPRTVSDLIDPKPEVEATEAGEPGEDAESEEGEADGDAGEAEKGGLNVPLSIRGGTVAVLGPSRRQGDFRVVTVGPDDTFSTLVLKWCGSLDYMDEAKALNETLDVNRIVPGREVWLPWIEDDVLLAAYEQRQAGRLPGGRTPAEASGPVANAGGDVIPPAARRPAPTSLGSEIHVVAKGESLWAIAARKVGAAKATDYVDEIIRANGIEDASRVPAGLKIVLP